MALLKGRTASAQAAPREPAIFAKKIRTRTNPHVFIKNVGPADFFFQRTLMKLNFRIIYQDIDNKLDPKSDVHD